ncbi:prolyl oligopeptidase family serine peptidase, partial [Patescibacteria group bacterium]|nr:prolyl oligopeptidase family serine peptidase [Patescibacteria group bacterium]
SYDSMNVPSIRQGKYFFIKHCGLQNQPVLFIKKNNKTRILIDPNKLSKQGKVSLDWWYPSRDGSLIAYGLSRDGDENSVLYIKDIESGKNLPDKIPYTNFCDITWLLNSTGFYYTRMPILSTVPNGDEYYYERVYFHKIGTSYKNDPIIFGEKREKEDKFGVELSKDGRFLLVTVYKGWVSNDIYVFDRLENKWVTVIENLNAIFKPKIHRDSIYILTNYKSPNFKICEVSLKNAGKGIKFWKTIIKEEKYPIEEFQLVSDHLFVLTIKNIISILNVFNLKGKFLKNIKVLHNTSSLSSIYSLNSEEEGKELFFSSQSFFSPSAVYRIEIPKLKISIWGKSGFPIKIANYKARQVWYKSKDNVSVPMFILYKKRIIRNSKNPLLLTGYGGFSVSLTPYFAPEIIPFLDSGGICAIANIRGGGEFGEIWHKSGMLDKKQNSFDDFIKAAEWLINNNYTNSQKLAIQGGSNGGLLVAAALVQRPELFRVAVANVPLFDMIRYEKSLIGQLWNKEYGSVENKKEFLNLLKYSPYHNIKKGLFYPAILINAGEKDTRVDSSHSKKMCASFQQNTTSDLPIILCIESKSGHGSGKPLSTFIKEYTDIWSFIFQQLGISK